MPKQNRGGQGVKGITKEYQREYETVGKIGRNIVIIKKKPNTPGRMSIPTRSRTKNRIYVMIDYDNKPKYIGIYNGNALKVTIDYTHYGEAKKGIHANDWKRQTFRNKNKTVRDKNLRYNERSLTEKEQKILDTVNGYFKRW